jgi:hypothetical protein
VYSEKFQEMFERGFLAWYRAKGLDIDDVKNYYTLLGQMRAWGGKKFKGTRRQQQALIYEAQQRGIETPKRRRKAEPTAPVEAPKPKERIIDAVTPKRVRKREVTPRARIVKPTTRTQILYFYRGRFISKPRRYNILTNATMHRVKIRGKTRTQYRHKFGEKKGRYIARSDLKRRVMYKDTKTGKIIGKPTRKKVTYTTRAKK